MSEDNYYMAEYGIQTLHIGDGNTLVCTVEGEDGLCGVGFGSTQGAIGEFHPELRGEKVDNVGVFFQILTNNPDSLQVVIDRLCEAKTILLKGEEL